MTNNIYSPMEKVLIEGALMLHGDDSREEVLPAANSKYFEALKLDLMLLELESKVGLMDGLPLEGGADNG